MDQKTAVVTGAARGIGLATADLFLEMGWRVVMVDRDAEALEAEAGQRQSVRAVACDVSDPDAVAAMAEAAIVARGEPEIIASSGTATSSPRCSAIGTSTAMGSSTARSSGAA